MTEQDRNDIDNFKNMITETTKNMPKHLLAKFLMVNMLMETETIRQTLIKYLIETDKINKLYEVGLN